MTRQQLEDWMNEHNVPQDAQVLVELDMGLMAPVNPDYRILTQLDADSNNDISIGDSPFEELVNKFVVVL